MRRLKILSAGYDRELLSIRSAILMKAGYDVIAATTHDQVVSLAPEAEGVILGSGIPSRDRAFLSAQLRELFPSMPIVVIYNANEEGGAATATASINSLDGPQALLDLLEQTFQYWRQQAG